MELNNSEKELIDILKAKNFEKDEIVAFVLSLNKGSVLSKFLTWVKGNNDADIYEVYEYLYQLV